MDAIRMLKEDHRRIRNLFGLIQEVEAYRERRRIYFRIRDELSMHASVEESVLYPAFAGVESMRSVVEKALTDHQEMKELLDDLRDASVDEFDVLCDELIERAETHLQMEETEFFPRVREALTQEQLDVMGDDLAAARAGTARKAA